MNKFPINLSALSYENVFKLMNCLFDDFEVAKIKSSTDKNFHLLYTDVKQQTAVFEKSISHISSKQQIPKLFVMERKRDKCFLMLRRAILVFRYSNNKKEHEAYLQLKRCMKVLINANRNSFDTEIAVMNDFIAELRSPDNYSQLEVLQIFAYVDELAAVNNEFECTYKQLIESSNLYESKQHRKKLLDAYRALMEYVYVMAKIKKTAYYIKTLNVLNEGRIHFAQVVKDEEEQRFMTK